MNLSFFYDFRSECDPTVINVIAVPNWLQVLLKSRGISIEKVWTQNPQDLKDILNCNDVTLHGDVSAALEDYLFGTHKYGTDKQEALEHLKKDWHALPFVEECELNLHPVILGNNLIGIVNLTGEDAQRVCETDIYERLLRCFHKLAVSQLGTKVWQLPLARAIIEKIQRASQAA